MVAAMSEFLSVDAASNVLDVGTGSGYQAAVLGEICKSVISIEIIEVLYRRSRQLLSNLEYENVECRLGDGVFGAPDSAPFNGIIVAAAAPSTPQSLVAQLAEGGVLVYPEGPPHGYQQLVSIRRKGGAFERTYEMGVRFVPMTGSIAR